MNQTTLDSTELVKIVAEALSDKKGADITAYDMRASANITDFHVLATGLNPPHLKALLNETRLRMKAHGLNCYRNSGTPESGWIVSDYVDIVAHFFLPDARAYYALDILWKDMPKLKIG